MTPARLAFTPLPLPVGTLEFEEVVRGIGQVVGGLCVLQVHLDARGQAREAGFAELLETTLERHHDMLRAFLETDAPADAPRGEAA